MISVREEPLPQSRTFQTFLRLRLPTGTRPGSALWLTLRDLDLLRSRKTFLELTREFISLLVS